IENADIICAPMQNITDYIAHGSATIVVCNPPYRRAGSGVKQLQDSVAIARHEIAVTLNEVIDTASKLLSTGGRFYIVHQTERLAEVIAGCKSKKLEPKVLQILAPNESKSPHLFMLKCICGAKEGLEVLPQRVVDTCV
ncbi:MAG: hypothetical protein IJY70_01105, partial [Clostridia bacterium]|nr:hypothetical protein [Clostridia bacterium]